MIKFSLFTTFFHQFYDDSEQLDKLVEMHPFGIFETKGRLKVQ